MSKGFGRRFRRVLARARSEKGVSLVEVLVAAAILALALGPMLDFSAYLYNGQAYQRQLKAQIAASTLEWLQNEAYRKSTWPWGGGSEIEVGQYIFVRTYTVSPAFTGTKEQNYLRRAEVTVWCNNCKDTTELRVVAYLAKVTPWSSSS